MRWRSRETCRRYHRAAVLVGSNRQWTSYRRFAPYTHGTVIRRSAGTFVDAISRSAKTVTCAVEEPSTDLPKPSGNPGDLRLACKLTAFKEIHKLTANGRTRCYAATSRGLFTCKPSLRCSATSATKPTKAAEASRSWTPDPNLALGQVSSSHRLRSTSFA